MTEVDNITCHEYVDLMAQIIDNPSWKTAKNYYPWEEWFDGKARLLKAGEDFSAKPVSMYNMVKAAAKYRGVEVRVRCINQEIQLQAIL